MGEDTLSLAEIWCAKEGGYTGGWGALWAPPSQKRREVGEGLCEGVTSRRVEKNLDVKWIDKINSLKREVVYGRQNNRPKEVPDRKAIRPQCVQNFQMVFIILICKHISKILFSSHNLYFVWGKVLQVYSTHRWELESLVEWVSSKYADVNVYIFNAVKKKVPE